MRIFASAVILTVVNTHQSLARHVRRRPFTARRRLLKPTTVGSRGGRFSTHKTSHRYRIRATKSMTEEEQKQRFSPAPLDATTSCSDYASALKVHGNLTDAEIDQIEKKHPQTKSYDVSKEIVPRINYLKFLEGRDRLGDEEAKEFVIRQPQCLERKFEIVYEDVKSGYVALNKPFDVRLDTPRGWPGKVRFTPKFDGDASCEDFLASRFPNEHVRFCHQLDNATSGVLLCALTKKAAGVAAKMFRERRTKKFYSAVVFGWPEEDCWTSRKKIGKDDEDETGFREKVREDELGKDCKTEFEVLKRGYLSLEGKHWNKRVSLVRVRIFTGRRHQIRVHLKDCGFPIVGDAAYADDEDTYRTFLHAEDLELFYDVAGVKYDKKTNKKKKQAAEVVDVEKIESSDSSDEDKSDEVGENMLKLHAPRPSAFEDIISETDLEES